MEMSMTGTVDERIRTITRLANDQVLLSDVRDPHIKQEELTQSRRGCAALNDRTRALCDVSALNLDGILQASGIDYQIRKHTEGAGSSERNQQDQTSRMKPTPNTPLVHALFEPFRCQSPEWGRIPSRQ